MRKRVPAHATTAYGVEAEVTGVAWRPRIRAAGSIERDAEALRRLVDETRNPAKFYYYEAVSDPDAGDESGTAFLRRVLASNGVASMRAGDVARVNDARRRGTVDVVVAG